MDPAGRGDPERDERLRASAAHLELRPAHRATWLGARSLACPGCGVPIRLSGPVGWRDELLCGFCETEAPIRDFLQDEGWPEVNLVARFR
jgi:hypothetical protein